MLLSCNAILGNEPQHLRAVDAAATDGGLAVDTGTDGGAGAGDGAAGTDATSTTDGAASSAYAREVLADSPLFYLRFGETGGTTAHDEKHAFDGTYPSFGARFAVPGALAGDPNGAIHLDGQAPITMPATADFTGTASFSVEVWLQRDAAQSGLAFVVDHEDWTGVRAGWNLLGGSDGLGFERYANDTDHASVSAAAPPADTWHHVLATWDGTILRVFVDGALGSSSGVNAVSIPALGKPFSIGGQNCSCTGNAFVGAIDELAVYDKVLTGDRALAHLKAAGK
jgi:hypothetical protein